jgi:hypothetical protein
MESLLLTCIQAQLLIARVNTHNALTVKQKNDIVWEVKQVTKKSCFIDANAD